MTDQPDSTRGRHVDPKTTLGRRGEEAAARYLTGLGWHIIDRNWRCPNGELDLVARDGAGLVVCEVKTRSTLRFGSPVEAVDNAKAARLRRLAERWAAEHGYRGAAVRIDVIGLVAGARGQYTVDHLRAVC
jgi:putative endonuclease